VPASPWLGDDKPGKPKATVLTSGDRVEVKLRLPRGIKPWQWVVRTQMVNGWKTAILPGDQQLYVLKIADGAKPKAMIISAISRLGCEGPTTRLEIHKRD